MQSSQPAAQQAILLRMRDPEEEARPKKRPLPPSFARAHPDPLEVQVVPIHKPAAVVESEETEEESIEEVPTPPLLRTPVAATIERPAAQRPKPQIVVPGKRKISLPLAKCPLCECEFTFDPVDRLQKKLGSKIQCMEKHCRMTFILPRVCHCGLFAAEDVVSDPAKPNYGKRYYHCALSDCKYFRLKKETDPTGPTIEDLVEQPEP